MPNARIDRAINAALGVLVLGTGLYVLLFSHVADLWRYAAGVGLVVLGVNAVHAALRGTSSWLSKLGPLP